MTKKLALIGIGIFTLLSAGGSAVMAGLKLTSTVTINTNTASGAMGDVRNASDGTQYIGCHTGNGYIFCAARTSAGVGKTCYSTDPNLISVGRDVSGATQVQFSFDVNGYCTDLVAYNYSYYRPMTP